MGRLGRPRKGPEKRGKIRSFRIPPSLDDALQNAADFNGWSVADEILMRLTISLSSQPQACEKYVTGHRPMNVDC